MRTVVLDQWGNPTRSPGAVQIMQPVKTYLATDILGEPVLIFQYTQDYCEGVPVQAQALLAQPEPF